MEEDASPVEQNCLQNGHGRRIYVYLPCFFLYLFS